MKNSYIVIAVLILAGACSSDSTNEKQAQLEKLKSKHEEISKQIAQLESDLSKANPEAKNIKAKEVNITEVTTRSFDHYVQTQGQVEAEDNILVSAKMMGVITSVLVNEGQTVSKGQTLAQIDNSIIVHGIEEAKGQLDLANTVYERQKNLWDQKIGTEVQYLQAKTNKESLEKRLASLNEQNEMTRIKSPINGTVDALKVKVGENIAPGMPAARVVNTSNLKITANISEAHIISLKVGNKVIVSIPELKKDIEARVTFVGKTIDPLSRTFAVEVKLPSYNDLRPNMTGVVKVVYFTDLKALVVPVNVVQALNNEKVVYVAESDGKNMIARKRVVTVSGVFDNLAQITNGLSAGDKIISFGYQGLSDGDVVKM